MHAKHRRIVSTIMMLTTLSMLASCSSSWEDAKQANTYKSYQAYLADHPEGEHVKEAHKRADSLLWVSIQDDTTAKAFRTYLDKFPEGKYRSKAQTKRNQLSGKALAAKGRVTGSGVIIRSDHSTASSSKGVVAKKGTEVQILDQYGGGNSSDAILKHSIAVTVHRQRIKLAKGKALHIKTDFSDSVKVSFSTSQFGPAEATISKEDIEAMSGQKWYKIRTTDDITGWIYGKFIKEL